MLVAALRWPKKKNVKINLVCYEDLDSWIIGKIARRLSENLIALGHQVTLGKEPVAAAEINHHILFHSYSPVPWGVHTVMVTHIDTALKLRRVEECLETARAAICTSREGVRKLVELGISPEKVEYAHFAHDGRALGRKTIVGISTRLYPDGRKRESDLVRLLDRIRPGDFSFKIMGFGWAPIVEDMRRRGFDVEYEQDFDYDKYLRMLASLDYYLYLGEDEGSAGFIDALAAGVKTIVQPQGFHLDAEGGITHSFKSFAELSAVFAEIARDRQKRVDSVAGWTWENYARKHVQIWEMCMIGKPLAAEIGAAPVDKGSWFRFTRRISLWLSVFASRFRMVLNMNKDYECGSKHWTKRLERKRAAERKDV